MQLDALRNRLEEHARGERGAELGWEVHVYAGFARVQASTPNNYPTAGEAFEAAHGLCEKLLGSDLALVHEARIGATGGEAMSPPGTWRGWVEIGIEDAVS